jgi:hypothetical protein
MNWKGYGRKLSWHIKVLTPTEILLEGLTETKKYLNRNIRCFSWDSNRAPPAHKLQVLPPRELPRAEPLLKVISRSAIQEIHCLLQNPRAHYVRREMLEDVWH